MPVIGSVVATKLRIPKAPSMPLDRLDARLDGARGHMFVVVVAPAGSGKTTLLTRFAHRAAGPVGWYRAEAWDRDEQALLRHVEAALGPSLNGVERDWRTVEDAANALESWSGEPVLLVVDDLHTLQGTPAEAALERLIDYAPDSMTFAVASRVPPSFNLSRLRLSGALLELSGEDLRFRSWEVERLFRDFYDEPLLPEDLARLARQTEGWAAGLQLFHLATRGRPPDERRRLLAELSQSSRLTRDYLTRNVLDQMPVDTRRFLLDTSVLGRLSGPLCDRLLARSGSGEILAELEVQRVFTQALPEEGFYRYHEVLRSHLLAALVDELGEVGMRERFRSAGAVLAAAGAVAEALEAYCRAEDWDEARRLLDGQGEQVVDRPNAWLEALPHAMIQHDPWLLMASARRMRAEGRFRDAVERYQRAEAAFGQADRAALCRDERQALLVWLDGAQPPRPEPSSLLRGALRRDPLSVIGTARSLLPGMTSLVIGLAALAAGTPARARRELLHAAERPESSPLVQIVASLGAGAAGLLMGQAHALLEVEGAVAAAEASGIEWLARVGRAVVALTGTSEAINEAQAVAEASAAQADDWGEAVARLCAAWGSLVAEREISSVDRLIALLRSLDVPVLEAWARAMVALAAVRAGEPDAMDEAMAVAGAAHSVGSSAADMLAYLALAEAAADSDEADEYRDAALAIAQESGLQPPVSPDRPSSDADIVTEHAPPVSIRVLGGYELRFDGQEVDLSAVRPRARALLRLLSVNAGTRVHHETIETALWLDADAAASARNLHVAMAALRRALEPAAMRGSFQLLRRDGDAYILAAPPDSVIDITRFEAAVAAGNAARARGALGAAAAAYQEALDLYRGDLLPEDGPAEWVAPRREACRLAAVEATQGLAEILLARGEAGAAARACNAGLRIERYHDPLWRLLIQARDQAGDQGAATRARLGYDRMLAELGVVGATSSSPL